MSKLSIDQATIKKLFEDKKSDFLIPDYQRPYAWTGEECQTLWEDIFTFAFPDNDYSKFNSDDEYYLGPIVTFGNTNNKKEVIDGQQRLTTLMLLLRAFYARYGNMQDDDSKRTRESIEKCIWKTDEFGRPDMTKLKIDSEVSTDEDKEEFLNILKTGNVEPSYRSKYAENYRFFQCHIDEFLARYPSYFSYLPTRILNNCILLPIEADNQDTALRIFSTLNDRGLPLSDADIFKAQFYKFFSEHGKKAEFIQRWKELEAICEEIFRPSRGTPMDELFTRYMYYERAKLGIKSSTTEALRKFYERDSYSLLKSAQVFDNLADLAHFWRDVETQDAERFSSRVLRQLFILHYAPNSMWTYFISVYFMQNRDADNNLDDKKFYLFLKKVIAFVWAYAIEMPGVNALRTPIFAEMINLIDGQPVEFANFKFHRKKLDSMFMNYTFGNARPITKSMLVWYAFSNPDQELLPLDMNLDIEHIYARKRQEVENGFSDAHNLESLGNKSILEKGINIRASDYRFSDKKRHYQGYVTKNGNSKPGTRIKELLALSGADDFAETDAINRNRQIIESFLDYLVAENLTN